MYFIKRYYLIPFVFFSGLALSNTVVANTPDKIQTSTEQVNLKVNINTATAEELSKNLKGVGLSKAKQIVAYRDKFGPFITIEQLKEVSGIGQSILDKNGSLLTL